MLNSKKKINKENKIIKRKKSYGFVTTWELVNGTIRINTVN